MKRLIRKGEIWLGQADCRKVTDGIRMFHIKRASASKDFSVLSKEGRRTLDVVGFVRTTEEEVKICKLLIKS